MGQFKVMVGSGGIGIGYSGNGLGTLSEVIIGTGIGKGVNLFPLEVDEIPVIDCTVGAEI